VWLSFSAAVAVAGGGGASEPIATCHAEAIENNRPQLKFCLANKANRISSLSTPHAHTLGSASSGQAHKLRNRAPNVRHEAQLERRGSFACAVVVVRSASRSASADERSQQGQQQHCRSTRYSPETSPRAASPPQAVGGGNPARPSLARRPLCLVKPTARIRSQRPVEPLDSYPRRTLCYPRRHRHRMVALDRSEEEDTAGSGNRSGSSERIEQRRHGGGSTAHSHGRCSAQEGVACRSYGGSCSDGPRAAGNEG
jgi:hypothetical protein